MDTHKPRFGSLAREMNCTPCVVYMRKWGKANFNSSPVRLAQSIHSITVRIVVRPWANGAASVFLFHSLVVLLIFVVSYDTFS